MTEGAPTESMNGVFGQFANQEKGSAHRTMKPMPPGSKADLVLKGSGGEGK